MRVRKRPLCWNKLLKSAKTSLISRPSSKRSGGIFDLEARETEIARLNQEMTRPDFWDKPQESQDIIEKLKTLKKMVDPWQKAHQQTLDLTELLELLDEHQADSVREMETELKQLSKDVEDLEFRQLLSDPRDVRNAIVSINAGAGGTESCDWASMLLRMYYRWAEQHGYGIENVDLQHGEEAGVKGTTFMVQGPYAFGYLKAESGVHRLVRISPFDANKRRHTSFASVDVIAEVDDIPEVEVKDSELRIEAYRAGGAGGQHVNKTSSAIRLTHLATGITVQCQNERSQHQNKMVAMKVLKARLYERYLKDREAEMKSMYGEKKDNAWGSQIRSYVLHPYSMVKDHRTSVETSNTGAVLDGDLDEFIHVYLKQRVSGAPPKKK